MPGTRQPLDKLLLFGATGDLSQRMLLPSLYGLDEDGLLPANMTITGTARTVFEDGAFRKFAKEALEKYLPEDRKDKDKIASFLKRLNYQALDATEADHFKNLSDELGDTSKGLAIFL